MPINAPPEYFKAEEKFRDANTKEERIAALEEMIRLLPKHKGAEHLLAQLRAKLSKIRKEKTAKKGHAVGIKREGDAQVCIVGKTNAGKSSLLRSITNSKAKISKHQYTTTSPQIGMMDYKGIKVQLIEIPSFFRPRDLGTIRTADAVLILYKTKEERAEIDKILNDNFIRVKRLYTKPDETDIKGKIWSALDLIIVYPKKTRTPMALHKGATIRQFASRVHKDFVSNFRFARVHRNKRIYQVGLGYKLKDGDVVDIHMK